MFCHNCGANAGNAKFCPECGTRIVSQEDPASRGSGTLTLRKYNARKMKDISADVYIDGAFLAVISHAESQSFTLPAGNHELLIHADGCVDALQHISIEPLENRLCVFSVDDVGIINIVQEGNPSRSAAYPKKLSFDFSSGGAAVAYAEQPEQMPVTRSNTAFLEETWSEDRWKNSAGKNRELFTSRQTAITPMLITALRLPTAVRRKTNGSHSFSVCSLVISESISSMRVKSGWGSSIFSRSACLALAHWSI